jgi:stage V sporulation protein R
MNLTAVSPGHVPGNVTQSQSRRLVKKAVQKPSMLPGRPLPGEDLAVKNARSTFQGLDALSVYNRTRIKPAQAKPKFGGGPYPFDKNDILLGDHPDSPYLNQLHEWELKIWEEATKPRPGFPKGWIQPMDTLFQVSNQVELMEAAARSGFPSRYRHWAWGQDFNDQYQRQRFGLGRLYEMVINTNPSYAFLYDKNPVHAQKVVMAHVLGHTDFFKNNHMYSESNRNMVRVMADHKAKIEAYYQDPRLSRKATTDGVHPVEKFLNKFDALEWLIDMNALSPPPLDSDLPPKEDLADQDFGKAGMKAENLGVAPWMQDYLYTHDEWEDYRDKTITQSDEAFNKTLQKPTRDILGFLVSNSKAMQPWQKDIMRSLREESYYFVPQVRTKLMNEGWATFWHHKMMTDCPSLVDESETAEIAKMMAGVEAPAQNGINPYQLGYAIFKNIYTRAAYGLEDFDTTFEPNKVIRYEDINKRLEEREPNEEAGLKKVLEVRKWYNDVEFVREFFTPEVAAELGMVVTNEREEWDSRSQQRVKVKYVESDDFKQLKEMILANYQNTFPVINLVDANFNNNDELLMKHENTVQDLDLADTRETLAVLNEFWGRPVHLDTMFEVEGEDSGRDRGLRPLFADEMDEPPKADRKPVRLTYKDGKMEIFTLTSEGKPDKNITDLYF